MLLSNLMLYTLDFFHTIIIIIFYQNWTHDFLICLSSALRVLINFFSMLNGVNFLLLNIKIEKKKIYFRRCTVAGWERRERLNMLGEKAEWLCFAINTRDSPLLCRTQPHCHPLPPEFHEALPRFRPPPPSPHKN